jgi:hypothetical protein
VLETLIDRMYEAAGSPKLWPDAIQCLSAYAESDRGSLVVLPQVGSPRWIASPVPECRTNSAVAPPSYRNTGRHAQWHPLAHSQFVRDVNGAFVCCGSEMCHVNEPSWRVGTAIQLPTGDLAVVTAERRAEHGPFGACILSRLDALRPHLVRACHLSAQFGYERARITTTALDRIGLPAAVLTASGRILAMNNRLQASYEKTSSGQSTDL